MSFSTDVKKELAELEVTSPCCLHAQVYGLVLFAHFTKLDFSVKTENKTVYDLYCKCVEEYLGCRITEKKSGSKVYIAGVESPDDIRRAFGRFGHTEKDMTLRINHANLQNECCISAFLRGAFLACGSIADPEKNYHLEFATSHYRLCKDLITLLGEINLSPKYIRRKGNHIVYFKDSENIEDLLTCIGAQNASLILMNIKIEKDMNNRVNRMVNFDMHNINKTISAAETQKDAIYYIKGSIGLASLPPALREAAELRIKNPEASLSELASLSETSVSRSGMKHRLDRIVELAAELREKREKQ